MLGHFTSLHTLLSVFLFNFTEMAAADSAGAIKGEDASAGAPYNCLGAIRSYLDKIIKPKDKTKEINGMKALMLDRETVRVSGWLGVELSRQHADPSRTDHSSAITESNCQYGVHNVRDSGQRRFVAQNAPTERFQLITLVASQCFTLARLTRSRSPCCTSRCASQHY